MPETITVAHASYGTLYWCPSPAFLLCLLLFLQSLFSLKLKQPTTGASGAGSAAVTIFSAADLASLFVSPPAAATLPEEHQWQDEEVEETEERAGGNEIDLDGKMCNSVISVANCSHQECRCKMVAY